VDPERDEGSGGSPDVSSDPKPESASKPRALVEAPATSRSAPPPAPRPETPLVAERVEDEAKAMTVNEVIGGARGALDNVGRSARRLVNKGRYQKLRVSRNGKPVLPDIPIAAAAALEAASMYGAGIARVLAVNVGARFLFDVDVVNEADDYLEAGRAALLDGDLETAHAALVRAVDMDDTHAEAFLQLGIVRRMRGDDPGAREAFGAAHRLDPVGAHGRRALDIIRAMDARAGR
jgi:tetratricopeptide (TPR) repeat protein